ncbi:hypothetical protein [Verminephrobacter eiseniae]|uniref:Uncharacterized protein n=1 Tax=Verminephrobacter eiseniae (strain EF01-2) TaxID=391735 RepID=A1WSV9_VEREI|nr:hypothetical protein [Verminephrobacter eiseniae]ABM60716.1 hypothetical protein Veis_5030 [Verminephrobacter eiseniae EF01-2]MCW5287469.1 hypothetical protein [Verminephrobacter eiseniae]MCW5305786.1 hypothetical protein [Verminephrobacter eiseniae]MCW8182539.1 hypothetical protein [Verminephrobacter eiseniae]MCW8191723.1 hypothetical protein [Verminephrobacter eiseniae]
MAENQFTKGDTLPPGIEADPLAKAFVYRMSRDALMIVTNLHRVRDLPCMDMLAKIDAHLENPLHLLVKDGQKPHSGANFTPAGRGRCYGATLEGDRLTITAPAKGKGKGKGVADALKPDA